MAGICGAGLVATALQPIDLVFFAACLIGAWLGFTRTRNKRVEAPNVRLPAADVTVEPRLRTVLAAAHACLPLAVVAAGGIAWLPLTSAAGGYALAVCLVSVRPALEIRRVEKIQGSRLLRSAPPYRIFDTRPRTYVTETESHQDRST